MNTSDLHAPKVALSAHTLTVLYSDLHAPKVALSAHTLTVLYSDLHAAKVPYQHTHSVIFKSPCCKGCPISTHTVLYSNLHAPKVPYQHTLTVLYSDLLAAKVALSAHTQCYIQISMLQRLLYQHTLTVLYSDLHSPKVALSAHTHSVIFRCPCCKGAISAHTHSVIFRSPCSKGCPVSIHTVLYSDLHAPKVALSAHTQCYIQISMLQRLPYQHTHSVIFKSPCSKGCPISTHTVLYSDLHAAKVPYQHTQSSSLKGRPAEPHFQSPALCQILRRISIVWWSSFFSSAIQVATKSQTTGLQSKLHDTPPPSPSLALEVHAKAASRWLAQRSLPCQSQACVVSETRGTSGMWILKCNKADTAKQTNKQQQQQQQQKSANYNFPLLRLTCDTVLTIISLSDPQINSQVMFTNCLGPATKPNLLRLRPGGTTNRHGVGAPQLTSASVTHKSACCYLVN